MSLIASLTLLAAAGTGRLGFLTAGELADRCNDSAPTGITYCFAYVTAVYDTMRAYEIWLGEREFCVPGTISQSELRRKFVDYVAAHPDSRAGLAASGVAIALKEGYKCVVGLDENAKVDGLPGLKLVPPPAAPASLPPPRPSLASPSSPPPASTVPAPATP